MVSCKKSSPKHVFFQLFHQYSNNPPIFHQDNQGLVRLQELLHHSSAHQHNSRIVVKKLNFKDNDDNKLILKEVKQSGEIHIVLDCDYEKIRTVLKEAQAVGMMTAYHNYLITNFDLHLVDLDDFKYGGTNITAFRFVDTSQPEVVSVVESWRDGDERFPSKNRPLKIKVASSFFPLCLFFFLLKIKVANSLLLFVFLLLFPSPSWLLCR